MFHKITQCRFCGNTELAPLLDLGEQYLTGVFPRTATERITCGPLELVKCHGEGGCGLVQLHHSYDSSEMYGANYGYRSSLNRTMVEHLKAKVEKLTSKVPLKSSDLVLDIGSNDGTLLSFYPAGAEGPTVVGIDPTSAKFRQYYKPHITAIPEFFSAKTFQSHFGARKAKVITAIAMFYDLEQPKAFVEEIVQVLDDEGVWHFEQSYMPTMLEQNAYDTVCHEHLEYYGLHQIQWILNKCGLKILDVELNDINGGSFAITAAKQGSHYAQNVEAVEGLLAAEVKGGYQTLAPYEAFRKRVFEHRNQLLALINGLRKKGAKVLGYGASTKGNVILQFCGITPDVIPYIAEVNPDKFGAVTPGTHIPIISEKEAHEMKPDYLLVLPWHFKANLVARETAYLGAGGKMIFPLPTIEIVEG